MKKIWGFSILILLIIGVISMLLYNKSRIAEKMKKETQLSAYPVTVMKVSRQELPFEISFIGTIYGAKEVNVVSETQGRIVAINYEVGDQVSAGSVLAKVDDEIKLAGFRNAAASYEKATKDYERNQKLYKEKTISDAALDASKLAYEAAGSQYTITKRQLEDTKITAPFGGLITSRSVEIGTVATNGTPIMSIIDISILKIKVNVAEKDVFKLKDGDEVKVLTDIYPDYFFAGKIKNIGSKADEAHTYPVEINLPNSKTHPLKSGMFAKVVFTGIKHDNAIVIPREALTGSTKDPQVFVVDQDVVKLRKVAIGASYEKNIEIISGLTVGEEIVVNGQLNLQDNARITIVK